MEKLEPLTLDTNAFIDEVLDSILESVDCAYPESYLSTNEAHVHAVLQTIKGKVEILKKLVNNLS